MRSRLTLFLALLPISATAEVMDKEPTIQQVWFRAACLALIGFLACRFRWWLLPVAVLFTSSLVGEVTDLFVGPAIRREAGIAYVGQTWAAFVVATLAQLAGALLHVRSRRQTEDGATHPTVQRADG